MYTLSPAVIDDGERIYALATPGADGQVQTLVQMIDAIVWNSVSLPEALERRRWRSLDAQLALEAGFDESLPAGSQRAATMFQTLVAGHGVFGAAAAAGLDRRTGTLFAAADPRRETWAPAC